MHYTTPLMILLLFPSASLAQKSFLGRFLSAAVNDSQINAQRDHQQVVKNAPFSAPYIGDAEIRIRNRSFDIGAQRYSLKLEPRGIGETNALRRYRKSQERYETVHYYYMLNELLLLRYIYFIDMLERKSLADGYRDLIHIYEDRIRVMEQLKNSTDFDLTDLIKAEKELAKLISEQIEERQEVATANRYIAGKLSGTPEGEIDTIGLISVAAIKKEIGQTTFSLDTNNIYLKDVTAEFEISEMRYKLEKAQSRKLVSFVEFSYDHGSLIDEYARRDDMKDYDLYNAYIIELGIKIPWLSNRNDDIARRHIDYLRDKEEFQSLSAEMASKITKDEADTRAYIERYELLTLRETEADAEASLKKYLEMSGVDPLVLLTIHESLVKNRLEKEKIQFSILRNYIYMMDAAGKLVEKPFRNFLSAQHEEIGQ